MKTANSFSDYSRIHSKPKSNPNSLKYSSIQQKHTQNENRRPTTSKSLLSTSSINTIISNINNDSKQQPLSTIKNYSNNEISKLEQINNQTFHTKYSQIKKEIEKAVQTVGDMKIKHEKIKKHKNISYNDQSMDATLMTSNLNQTVNLLFKTDSNSSFADCTLMQSMSNILNIDYNEEEKSPSIISEKIVIKTKKNIQHMFELQAKVDKYEKHHRQQKHEKQQTHGKYEKQITVSNNIRRKSEKEMHKLRKRLQTSELLLQELNVDKFQEMKDEYSDMRKKIHDQRTEIRNLRSWKSLSRKKYLQHMIDVKDDIQELQSYSKIIHYKSNQRCIADKKVNKKSKAIVDHNYNAIIGKFNELQNDLQCIIQSYSVHHPHIAQNRKSMIRQSISLNSVSISDSKSWISTDMPVSENLENDKNYQKAMAVVQKIFDVKFDENEISFGNLCKIIEYEQKNNEQILKYEKKSQYLANVLYQISCDFGFHEISKQDILKSATDNVSENACMKIQKYLRTFHQQISNIKMNLESDVHTIQATHEKIFENLNKKYINIERIHKKLKIAKENSNKKYKQLLSKYKTLSLSDSQTNGLKNELKILEKKYNEIFHKYENEKNVNKKMSKNISEYKLKINEENEKIKNVQKLENIENVQKLENIEKELKMIKNFNKILNKKMIDNENAFSKQSKYLNKKICDIQKVLNIKLYEIANCNELRNQQILKINKFKNLVNLKTDEISKLKHAQMVNELKYHSLKKVKKRDVQKNKLQKGIDLNLKKINEKLKSENISLNKLLTKLETDYKTICSTMNIKKVEYFQLQKYMQEIRNNSKYSDKQISELNEQLLELQWENIEYKKKLDSMEMEMIENERNVNIIGQEIEEKKEDIQENILNEFQKSILIECSSVLKTHQISDVLEKESEISANLDEPELDEYMKRIALIHKQLDIDLKVSQIQS